MAEIYAIDRRLVLAGMTWWDEFGAWGGTKVMVALPADVDHEAVGRALRTTLLQAARSPVDTNGSSQKALLEAAGVRSRAALIGSARYVSATQRPDGSVLLVPSHRIAGQDGWSFDPPESGLVLDDPDDETLGRAVRQAVRLSR